jgi:uncharacterized protein YcbK (DUF882 family)
MTEEEVDTLRYFTKDEIEETGSELEDIDYQVFMMLDLLREMVERPIHLLVNGLTTGSHTSRLHKAGKAIDFYIKDLRHTDAVKVALMASRVGFNGIGVYWNHESYSFHVDSRKELNTWFGYKDGINSKREYQGLTFNFDQ